MGKTEEFMTDNDVEETKAGFNAKPMIFVLIFAAISIIPFIISTVKWGKYSFLSFVLYIVCMLLWLIPLILSIVKGSKRHKIPKYIIVLSILFLLMDLFAVLIGGEVSKYIFKNNMVNDYNVSDGIREDIQKVVIDYNNGLIVDGNNSYNELLNGVCISDWNAPYDDLQQAMLDEFVQSGFVISHEFELLPDAFFTVSSKSEVYVKIDGQNVFVELLKPCSQVKYIDYNDGRVSSPRN